MLGTKYLVLGTKYLVLGTKCLVLTTKYVVLGTKYFALTTKCFVPSTWYQALGTCHQVPGTRYQVLGTCSRKLGRGASIADDFEYIFGPVGLIFEESGPRESPCGTPDGRLGLPRRPETSWGGVGEDFQRFGGPQKDIFPALFRQKDALIERLVFDRHLETKPRRF